MPELPEVETIVRGLRTVLPGHTIVSVRLGKTDFIEDPAALSELLPGRRIERVERLGKFIQLQLSAGSGTKNADGQMNLVIHLGMTGWLGVRRPEDPVAPHTHAFFELEDGRELRYTDIRRFGQILLVPGGKIAASGSGSARSRWRFRPVNSTRAWQGAGRESKPCCSIKASFEASEIFMPTKVYGRLAFIRRVLPRG